MTGSITLDEAMAAIRAKCVDCSGGSRKEAECCCIKSCPLWRLLNGATETRPIKQISGQLCAFTEAGRLRPSGAFY